jgi:hypothetical protein
MTLLTIHAKARQSIMNEPVQAAFYTCALCHANCETELGARTYWEILELQAPVGGVSNTPADGDFE